MGVEGDLKLTQEGVADLERVKGELQGAAARKDKEGSALSAKIDDEATLGAKYGKQAKELQSRLEELDEELAIERGNRSKAEKNRSLLSREGTLAALRSKHNNSMAELGEQIDGLNKNKGKSEKDKAGMERDLQETRAALDEAMR